MLTKSENYKEWNAVKQENETYFILILKTMSTNHVMLCLMEERLEKQGVLTSDHLKTAGFIYLAYILKVGSTEHLVYVTESFTCSNVWLKAVPKIA